MTEWSELEKAKTDEMRRDIEAIEWEELMKDKNIEEAWNCFRRKMDEIVDQHVPRFVNTRKKRPDWITQDIARQIRKKRDFGESV